MELLLLLILVIILLAIFAWSRRTDPNLPPFPCMSLPIVGHLPYLGRDTRQQFKKWRKQCGDMFSLYMGGNLMIVLNGYDLMKEAFVKNADAFSDRSPLFVDTATGIPEKGISFSSGHNWKEQRSVVLTILKRFGLGKNILAEKIQGEVSTYINYLAGMKDHPVDIRAMTSISTSNVISSIIIDHRFDYDDKDFRNITSLLNAIGLEQGNFSAFNFMPNLKYIPGDFFQVKKITGNIKAVMSLMEKFTNLNRQDNINDDESFIDAYIAERKKKIKAGVPTYMDEENLTRIINDLFAAGTETTSTTIYWCVLFLINNPDIQEKVYREIKEIVGTHRFPTMQDRINLPYLNAVIMETQRLGSMVPHSLTHLCSQDVLLRGKVIPKGAFVVPNLDSVLHDKKIFGEDVMTFRPERFLDSTGKVLDREELIPFGIGRRMCLGQALAKMELFLFLSNMFQRFQFLSKYRSPPSYREYVIGMNCSPRPFEVRLIERK